MTESTRAGLLAVPALREIDWEEHLRDASGDSWLLSFLSGAGLGALVGILIAILLAPQPGRQVRAQVRHTGIELRARAPHRTPRPNAHDETLAEAAEQAEVDLARKLAPDVP